MQEAHKTKYTKRDKYKRFESHVEARKKKEEEITAAKSPFRLRNGRKAVAYYCISPMYCIIIDILYS